MRCDGCKKQVARTYEVAGLELCGECITPPNPYMALETFFAAIQSGKLNKNEVTFHFDGMTFYAMSKDLETEYISGEWEEVYTFLKSHLSTLGLAIIEE